MWRSLVARFVRDEEAAGSNPVTPTSEEKSPDSSLAWAFSPNEEGVVGSKATDDPDQPKGPVTWANTQGAGSSPHSGKSPKLAANPSLLLHWRRPVSDSFA